MNKKAQIDALRGERIWDTMFYQEQEIWLERFFQRIAPWVDTGEQGDQGITGSAMEEFNAGRVTVLDMAAGGIASEAWYRYLFAMRNPACIVDPPTAKSKEVEARRKQLFSTKPTPIPTQKLASSIRALTSARITKMLQTEAPAFAAQSGRNADEFDHFTAEWSFRAGALVTLAIAEGKDTKTVIAEIVEDAFAASGGQFVDVDEQHYA